MANFWAHSSVMIQTTGGAKAFIQTTWLTCEARQKHWSILRPPISPDRISTDAKIRHRNAIIANQGRLTWHRKVIKESEPVVKNQQLEVRAFLKSLKARTFNVFITTQNFIELRWSSFNACRTKHRDREVTKMRYQLVRRISTFILTLFARFLAIWADGTIQTMTTRRFS